MLIILTPVRAEFRKYREAVFECETEITAVSLLWKSLGVRWLARG